MGQKCCSKLSGRPAQEEAQPLPHAPPPQGYAQPALQPHAKLQAPHGYAQPQGYVHLQPGQAQPHAYVQPPAASGQPAAGGQRLPSVAYGQPPAAYVHAHPPATGQQLIAHGPPQPQQQRVGVGQPQPQAQVQAQPQPQRQSQPQAPAGATASLVGKGANAKQDQGWIAETLRSHNELRAKHGAPPVTWSAECAAKAQMAADECAAQNTLHHCHHSQYGHGQNAFFGTPGMSGAKEVVEAWYSELNTPGYNNWNGKNATPGTGHFTQVVWKDCAEIGMACDASGKGFVVANYKPAGNMQGVFDKNVSRQGTPMQARKEVRHQPYSKQVTTMDAEVQSVLDSIPNEQIVKTILEKLRDGWTVKIDYKPAPNGSLKYEFKKGGASGSGSCSF